VVAGRETCSNELSSRLGLFWFSWAAFSIFVGDDLHALGMAGLGMDISVYYVFCSCRWLVTND
jgi:hypothetical protein